MNKLHEINNSHTETKTTMNFKLCCPMFQLVMQYLYCGGTESLHIRNTEVMEVKKRLNQSLLSNSTSISFSNPKSCFSFCVALLFPAALVCSQVLPTRGPSETLWDHLLQEHHHRNLRGPLQTCQGEKPSATAEADLRTEHLIFQVVMLCPCSMLKHP